MVIVILLNLPVAKIGALRIRGTPERWIESHVQMRRLIPGNIFDAVAGKIDEELYRNRVMLFAMGRERQLAERE